MIKAGINNTDKVIAISLNCPLGIVDVEQEVLGERVAQRACVAVPNKNARIIWALPAHDTGDQKKVNPVDGDMVGPALSRPGRGAGHRRPLF